MRTPKEFFGLGKRTPKTGKCAMRGEVVALFPQSLKSTLFEIISNGTFLQGPFGVKKLKKLVLVI